MITLEQSWDAVTAVAEALLKRKRLRGKTAEKIMAEKIQFRYFISFFQLTGEQVGDLLEADHSKLEAKEAKALA